MEILTKKLSKEDKAALDKISKEDLFKIVLELELISHRYTYNSMCDCAKDMEKHISSKIDQLYRD